jgi:hypothetical protein
MPHLRQGNCPTEKIEPRGPGDPYLAAVGECSDSNITRRELDLDLLDAVGNPYAWVVMVFREVSVERVDGVSFLL